MKTYHGSCHCGAIRYQADIDPAAGTVKCNCTICSKMRFWAAIVAPIAFRLLQGGESMREYRLHARGDAPGSGPFVAVTIASLDDMAVDEMLAGPVRYIDGRNDNWRTPPMEIRHL